MAAAMNGHGAARRHHSLLRHVPRVLRLLPSVDPPCGDDGRARYLRFHPTTPSASVKTARPISPVEHLAALRAIPKPAGCSARATPSRRPSAGNLRWNPARTPSVLALTRQNLPVLRKNADATNKCAAGGYEIAAANGKAQVSLFASGSEVPLAVEAKKLLDARGVATRVVSVPSVRTAGRAAQRKAPRRHRRRAGEGRNRSRESVRAGMRLSARKACLSA